MSKTWTVAALLVGLTNASGLQSESGDTLVNKRTAVLLELFTSEGCSSCPPADRLLQTLDQKQPFPGVDLVVLSEHVDYWNAGGWVDPYSSKLFSERQRWYAQQFGLDSVYTPQLVIDGRRETVGGNAAAVTSAVKAVEKSDKVGITLSTLVHEGNQLRFHIATGDLPAEERSLSVYIALAQDKVQSNVVGGENGGRSLTHVAVVRSLVQVGKVAAGHSFSEDVAVSMPPHAPSNGLRVIAFLQSTRSRKIAGVTQQKI